MSSVIDRIKKRAFYAVKLVNGETVHVCGVLNKFLTEARTFSEDEESVGYLIGQGLVDDSGQKVFLKSEDESSKEFGARVLAELDGMGPDIRQEIIDAIFKVSYTPEKMKPDAIVKN